MEMGRIDLDGDNLTGAVVCRDIKSRKERERAGSP